MCEVTQEWVDAASLSELMEVFGDDFDSSLNDIDGDIEVAGTTFQASDIMKNMDYSAYLAMFHDYVDNILDDLPSEDD